jgi:hypothetical protein
MSVLAFSGPDGDVKTHQLGDGRFTLGRGAKNDLLLDNPFISHRHLRLSSPMTCFQHWPD